MTYAGKKTITMTKQVQKWNMTMLLQKADILITQLEMCHNMLTLSLIQALSEASEADDLYKALLQKKKLLIMSNFSFCHNVFHF